MTDNNQFIALTPIGAYYAVNSRKDSSLHRLLRYLLTMPTTPQLDEQTLQECSKYTQIVDILAIVKQAIKNRLIMTSSQATSISETALETVLPKLFSELADKGKILLADDQGLCLGQIGFDINASEQLAALSADIAIVQQRHETALKDINEFGNIWGMINPINKHQVSFWPIFIGNHRFVLVLAQKMSLNQLAFTRLIQILSIRYA